MEDIDEIQPVEINIVDPADPSAQHCLEEYYAELDRRFDTGFDPGQALPLDLDEMRPPSGVFCVATRDGEPIGCGALKLHGGEWAELKRMWVASSARGIGLGRRLLEALEGRAASRGCRVIRLETNNTLREAIAMYRSSGYREIEAFNTEPYAHHWFEKQLEVTR